VATESSRRAGRLTDIGGWLRLPAEFDRTNQTHGSRSFDPMIDPDHGFWQISCKRAPPARREMSDLQVRVRLNVADGNSPNRER
jgi:hypothetical protein